MKIIPPAQGFVSILTLLLFVCLMPKVYSQGCDDCGMPDSTQELEGCDTNNDDDAFFDLTAVVLSNASNNAEYYENCTGGGNLNMTIGTPSNHMANDGDIIYVREKDINTDTCVQVIAVTLDVHNVQVEATANAAVICPGSMVTITAETMGDTDPLSYTWGVPSGSPNPGNVVSFMTDDPGSYVVTVTEEGCEFVSNIVLSLDELEVNITPTSGSVCDGSIDLQANVTGGSGNINYTWIVPNGQSGSSSDEITASVAGTYQVQVTRNGCTITSDPVTLTSHMVEINAPSGTVLCSNGANSSLNITANVVGGCSGCTYSWSTGATTPTISVTTEDTYTVTVTKDGCPVVESIEITDGTITIDEFTRTNESCAGENDGTITVEASGGSGTYLFELSNGMDVTSTSPYTFMNLPDGTYSITVSDSTDPVCEATDGPIAINPGGNINTSNVVPTPPLCRNGDDGKITFSVSGFTTSYTVTYNGGSSPSGQTSSSYTIEDLDPGTYTITVTDVAGCEDIINNVTVANPSSIIFNAQQLQASCENANTGSIRINNIQNGQSNYTITWSGPSNGSQSNVSSSYDITGLPDGNYDIMLTDANMCTSGILEVTVGVLPEVSVSITGDNVFCSDESSNTLSTSPSGFSSYSWNPGGASTPTISVNNPGPTSLIYQVTVTDSDGCTGSAQTQVRGLSPISVTLNSGPSKLSVTCSNDCDAVINVNVSGGSNNFDYAWTGPSGFTSTAQDIANICPGEYDLVVTDTEGCTATFSATVTVPDPIEAALIPSAVSCFGRNDGSITASVQGGTTPYSYAWSGGISQNSATVTNVSAGNYSVTISDNNNCFIVESVTVSQPDEVMGAISPSSPEICIGDQITLMASGGTSYQWANGQGNTQSITVSPSTTTNYMVTVTDANTFGCTDIVSVNLTVNPLPVIEIGVSENSGNASGDAIICEEDEITLNASGGSSYVWTGGNSNPYKFSPSVGTNTYVVTVTDNNGCVNTKTQEVTVNENPTARFVFDSPTQIVQDPQNIINTSTANCGELQDCIWTIDQNPNIGDCSGASPTFTTQGIKNISLRVENSCGCVDEFSNVLDIGASDQCAIINFVINDNESTACVGSEVKFEQQARASGGDCTLGPFEYTVRRGGQTMILGNQFNILSNRLIFNEVGEYEVELKINDGICGCEKTASRFINIIAPPDISFAEDNPAFGCEGETINIGFDNFDDNDKVKVITGGGTPFDYEIDNFDFAPSGTGVKSLRIISVDNGTCVVPVNNQTLEIDIVPKFEILSREETDCDDDFRFSHRIVVTGGDPDANLVADGIEGEIISGNVLQLNDLEPNTRYTFTLSKGESCEAIPVEIFKPQCNCFFNPGDRIVQDLRGCEDTVFDITDIFDTESDSSEFNKDLDTIVYILHLSGGDGQNLGRVFRILPGDATTLDNNFPGFIGGVPYKLSAVGLKKASLTSGLIVLDPNRPMDLSNMGRSDCLSVAPGTNVIWFRTPSPTIRTRNNVTEICRNAYDFPVFVSNPAEGTNISWKVIGLEDENVRTFGSQDTAYIYFEDNGNDSFDIVVTETVSFDGGNFVCEGTDTLTVFVSEGIGSPPLSQIIYFPGNILSSTADSSTTCFEWRFFRAGTYSSIESTDKYYFANVDADVLNGNDIYLVDTYFCENPECVTRVYFNNDVPLPGLNYKDEKTFQYLIKPNPNNGQFNLSLFSLNEGIYNIEVMTTQGKLVSSQEVFMEQAENVYEFDLQHLSKGIYFIRILDKKSKAFSIDRVVIH